LERVVAQHRMRARMIRALALIYLAEAGAIVALTFGTFGVSVGSVIMVAGTAAPLALVGIGLYAFDGRAWLLGVVLVIPTLLVSRPTGVALLAFASWVLLPRAGKEIFTPLYAEAREAELEVDHRSESWAPFAAFVTAAIVFFPWYRRSHASFGTETPLTQMLAPVLALALLFVFSRGRGVSGRARTQLMSWVAIALSALTGGPIAALGTGALFVVLLYVVAQRQRFPLHYPGREQPVDLLRFTDLPRLRKFLEGNGFRPFAQCVTTYATGTIAEELHVRDDTTICKLALTMASGVTASTVYLETWATDGRSVRSSDQLRFEEINDRKRHPLYWRARSTHDELLAQHLERCRQLTSARPATIEQYIQLRRASYEDSFRNGLLGGLVQMRGGEYRLTSKGCLRLIARAFNLKAALANENIS
jgi:hypothetical protein